MGIPALPPELQLSKATPAILAAYRSFWERRGKPVPTVSRTAVWVVSDETLVIGVSVFSTEGPYLLVEGFATNPDASPRLRHEATDLGLRHLAALGTIMGKTLVMIPGPSAKSVAKMASRLGFSVGRQTTPIYRHPS